jgi:SnoaL-like domain
VTSIELVDYGFGPSAANRLEQARDPDQEGALAALETFYYALNNADLTALSEVWSHHPLAQLNNPVGGIVRSGNEVVELYRTIFSGELALSVSFGDAATYWWPEVAVFAGRETGSYHDPATEAEVPLSIRTTRVFGYDQDTERWLQMHHHGSIDDPAALRAYQVAIRGPDPDRS